MTELVVDLAQWIQRRRDELGRIAKLLAGVEDDLTAQGDSADLDVDDEEPAEQGWEDDPHGSECKMHSIDTRRFLGGLCVKTSLVG